MHLGILDFRPLPARVGASFLLDVTPTAARTTVTTTSPSVPPSTVDGLGLLLALALAEVVLCARLAQRARAALRSSAAFPFIYFI